MARTSVLIIEDHQLLRESWSMVLNSHPLLQVVGEAGNAKDGLAMALKMKPGLVIMDINLPDIDGIEATKRIKKLCPQAKVIGVSIHTETIFVKKMMQNGASGYLTKCSGKDELFEAINKVLEGKTYLCLKIQDVLSQQLVAPDQGADIGCLSTRERAIAQMVKEGYSSREIADRFSISMKTVEVHRYNILHKLKLRNSAALVDFLYHHM
jgi:two-component system invasion response regulator UvrY